MDRFRRPILFITHEASRTGAPMFLLHFLRWLKAETGQPFEILVRSEGPLLADFARLGPVRRPGEFESGARPFAPYAFVYANTACNGLFLEGFDLADVPVVTHVHELDFGIDLLGARNFAAIARHTDRFIACADVVGAQLRRRFRIPAGRIAVHHEMFDPARADENAAVPLAPGSLERLGIPPDAPVIAGCGTVDLRKGVDLFVQLAGAVRCRRTGCPAPHFVWIGRHCDPGFAQLLAHDVRRAGLAGRVHLIGEQANPHAWICRAAGFALTSREDPFPLAMLEATALGKPLVAFAGSGGADELCALGAGTTVPFLDVGAMAACCGAWLDDPVAAAANGQAAAAIVRRRFSPAIVAPALWADLQAWAGTQRAPKPAGAADIYRSWDPATVPDRGYVEGVLAQDPAWRQVREVAAAGRRNEAALSIVRLVGAAMAAQDGRLIVETLLEAVRELAPLDAAKAGMLLRQAEQMLRAVPANSEWMIALKRDLDRTRSAWTHRIGEGRRVA